MFSDVHLTVQDDRSHQLGDGHPGSRRDGHSVRHQRVHQPKGQGQDPRAGADRTHYSKLSDVF